MLSSIAICGDYVLGQQAKAEFDIYVTRDEDFKFYDIVCEIIGLSPTDMDWRKISHVPALILSGNNDVITPPRHGKYLAKNILANCHFIVEGAGHGIAFRNRPEVDNLISAFWLDPDGFGVESHEQCS